MSIIDHVEAKDPQNERFRTNLLFCLFSKCHPEEWVEPSLRLVQSLREKHPDFFARALVGMRSTSYGKLTKAKWKRLNEEIEGAGEENAHFHSVGPTDRAPDYSLLWSTNLAARHEDYPRANLLELCVPLPDSTKETEHWEALFRKIAADFPFDTGYAAPALVPTGKKRESGDVIAPIALRFPGFDVPNNQWTAGEIGMLSRGARWLTFLSVEQADKLDEGLLSAPPDPVRVDRDDGMVVIRSSPEFQIGDLDEDRWPEGMPWVAELLRPITRFDDQYLLLLFRKDPSLVSEWEQRFFRKE